MNYTQDSTVSYEVAENTPNAAKLLSSLRHLDYSSTSAICDIVDNCIDAEAKNIRIKLHAKGNKGIFKIEIWDDGCGMDDYILSEALRLGSDTVKNHQYDLGRYGMGLVTASLSIGEKLSVTTLYEGISRHAVQDLDHIRETNSFSVKRRNLSDNESLDFLKNLKNHCSLEADSGTLVTLEKIDRWQWTQLTASEKNLTRELGIVFRKFITDGDLSDRTIYVNDVRVEAIDPIHDFEPTLLAEENFEIDNDIVNVKLYELNDYGAQGNKSNNLNIHGQGFYVLRNNRQIAAAQDFGLFNRHNDYNLFRAEFSYPGSLDHLLNAGFTKQKIDIENYQSFYDKLNRFVPPYIKQVRGNSKNKQKDNRDKKEDFTEVEKHITRKAHLLRTAKAEKERRHRNKEKVERKNPEAKREGSPRLDITKKKRIRNLESLNVKFNTRSMDKAGPLYSCEMEGNVTVINWNIDHPFYEGFYIPNEDNKDVVYPICYLVYSLAQAELRSKEQSDSLEIIENIRADFSTNLKVLMN